MPINKKTMILDESFYGDASADWNRVPVGNKLFITYEDKDGVFQALDLEGVNDKSHKYHKHFHALDTRDPETIVRGLSGLYAEVADRLPIQKEWIERVVGSALLSKNSKSKIISIQPQGLIGAVVTAHITTGCGASPTGGDFYIFHLSKDGLVVYGIVLTPMLVSMDTNKFIDKGTFVVADSSGYKELNPENWPHINQLAAYEYFKKMGTEGLIAWLENKIVSGYSPEEWEFFSQKVLGGRFEMISLGVVKLFAGALECSFEINPFLLAFENINLGEEEEQQLFQKVVPFSLDPSKHQSSKDQGMVVCKEQDDAADAEDDFLEVEFVRSPEPSYTDSFRYNAASSFMSVARMFGRLNGMGGELLTQVRPAPSSALTVDAQVAKGSAQSAADSAAPEKESVLRPE